MEDKILVSVEVKRKKYYNADIIESCLQDGQLAYKKGDNFCLITIKNDKMLNEVIKIMKEGIEEEKDNGTKVKNES